MRDGPFSAEQQRTIDDLTARLAIITKATTMLLDYLSKIAHDARERARALESVLEEKGSLTIDELRRAVAVTQREERALFQLDPEVQEALAEIRRVLEEQAGQEERGGA
jgi:uncharacterized protein YoxC